MSVIISRMSAAIVAVLTFYAIFAFFKPDVLTMYVQRSSSEAAQKLESIRSCNSGSDPNPPYRLLWDPDTYDNFHLLLLNDICIQTLVEIYGAKALETVFAYGKPELLLNQVDIGLVANRTLTSIEFGDRFVFRNSEGSQVLLEQIQKLMKVNAQQSELIFGFIYFANPKNNDPDQWGLRTKILSELSLKISPLQFLGHAKFIENCSNVDSCSNISADSKLSCNEGEFIPRKKAFVTDGSSYFDAFVECSTQLPEVVKFNRIIGVYDGYCSFALQSLAAQEKGYEFAADCQRILRQKKPNAPTRVLSPFDALYMGWLTQRYGYKFVSQNFQVALAEFGIENSLHEFEEMLGGVDLDAE